MIGQANHYTNHRCWYIIPSDPAKVGGRISKENQKLPISFFPVRYQDPTFPLQAAREYHSMMRHELIIWNVKSFILYFRMKANTRTERF